MRKEIQKQMKGKRGITLVALVVTIVVLLILAGITISTLFGDNGIISAARKAADDTKQDESNTEQGIKDLTDEMNKEINGGLNASLIYKNASKYYGQKVNYTAGVTGLGVDWKIFYADSDHIYLISSDYIPKDKLPASTDASGNVTTNKPDTSNTYYPRGASFAPILNDYSTGSARIADNVKYLNKSYFDFLSSSTYYSTNPVTNDNMKAVAYMLDTKAWEGFKDSSGKADFVIGGPTIEMLFNSYCQKNNFINSSGANQYQARVQSATGYQISSDYGNSWKQDLFADKDKILSNDQLYTIDSQNNAWDYWLASPSSSSTSDLLSLHYTIHTENLYHYSYSHSAAFRPLVALKSNVALIEQQDGSFNIK